MSHKGQIYFLINESRGVNTISDQEVVSAIDHLPPLLQKRWKFLKKELYEITCRHKKSDILVKLLELKENHTSIPNLSEITNFTGFDVAIHRILKWKWRANRGGDLNADAATIGKIGAELNVIHAIGECIRHGLFEFSTGNLNETEIGEVHFSMMNSFNVEVTGSRIDIAKKRFSQSRQGKRYVSDNPLYKAAKARKLYWENSVLMILRAPLTFYRSMAILNDEEQEEILKFHDKLINKVENQKHGMVRIRLKKKAKITSAIRKLLPKTEDPEERRPKYVIGYEIPTSDKETLDFQIGIGGLTMFVMFLTGFNREQLDEKARRAEEAVSDLIEKTGYWKVQETNIEINSEEGESLTEIDIIAQSILPDSSGNYQWVHCEVKDFSYWRGWIFGYNHDIRKTYFEKAVGKLPIKESFIKEKFSCNSIKSYIVTSVPEVYETIDDTPIIYLNDLYDELLVLAGQKPEGRRRMQSGNFFIRYFERLNNDLTQAMKVVSKKSVVEVKIANIEKMMENVKGKFKDRKAMYEKLFSTLKELNTSEKFARKRFLKDDGSKHYVLESELSKIRADKKRVQLDLNRYKKALGELKGQHGQLRKEKESLEQKLIQHQRQLQRFQVPRSI